MPEADHSPPNVRRAGFDLGSVVFGGRPNNTSAVVVLVVGLPFVGLALLLLLLAGPVSLPVVAPVALMGLIFCTIGGVWLSRNRGTAWNLHQRGAVMVRRGRAYALLYEDVDELTLKTTRVFTNGIYGGTVQEVELFSNKPELATIRFKHVYREKTGLATGYGEANEVLQVCDHIAGLIAARMTHQLAQGRAVSWGRHARIHPWGIEVLDAKTDSGERVGWERIARLDLQAGVLQLWVEGEAKPRLRLSTGAHNFFPGYRLVVAKLRPSTEKPSPAQEEPPVANEGRLAPPDAGGGFAIEYANDLEDHIALDRYADQATREGRMAWRVRTWPLPLTLIVLGVVSCLAQFYHGKITARTLAILLPTTVAGGLVLIPLLRAVLRLLDRFRIARELKVSHERALRGDGIDPFCRWEVSLGPTGYLLRTRCGERRCDWKAVSRVECFQDRIFVFLAGDKVSRETIGLLIPPRAFATAERVREVYEMIRQWHADAKAC